MHGAVLSLGEIDGPVLQDILGCLLELLGFLCDLEHFEKRVQHWHRESLDQGCVVALQRFKVLDLDGGRALRGNIRV